MSVTEQQVRDSIAEAKNHLEQAARHIVWQVRNKAWVVLGYPSWSDMVDAEYGGVAAMVPRNVRGGVVADLHAEGLSQQVIAKTLGVSQQTVSNDVTKIGNVSTTRVDSLGRTQPTQKKRGRLPTPEEREREKFHPAPEPTDPTYKALHARLVSQGEASKKITQRLQQAVSLVNDVVDSWDKHWMDLDNADRDATLRAVTSLEVAAGTVRMHVELAQITEQEEGNA